MTCQCPLCTATPAPSYTPEFMELCEARYIARLLTNEDRARYLEDVERRRGKKSAEELRLSAWTLVKNA